jgi:hypothetical protein
VYSSMRSQVTVVSIDGEWLRLKGSVSVGLGVRLGVPRGCEAAARWLKPACCYERKDWATNATGGRRHPPPAALNYEPTGVTWGVTRGVARIAPMTPQAHGGRHTAATMAAPASRGRHADCRREPTGVTEGVTRTATDRPSVMPAATLNAQESCGLPL